MTLRELKTGLVDLLSPSGVKVYHYYAGPQTPPEYVVFHEHPTEDFTADNIHEELEWSVSVSLYTKKEFPPAARQLTDWFQREGIPWRYEDITYQADEDIILHEWTVSVAWDEAE